MTKPLILALCALILLGGCSSSFKAQRHLRKAKAHILKAEALGAVWHTDTIYKQIQVVVPEIKKDTIFKAVLGDTVTIEKERLKIKYVRLAGDSVFIEGTCKADTVYKEVPVVINKSIPCPPDKWKFPAFVFAGLFIAILATILFFISRRKD